jgi:23S rRNA (uracil1939-C5)-methyltransferase
VVPPCPAFSRCGGCEWQHLSYDLQWKTKVSGVKHALQRVKVDVPAHVTEFPAKRTYGYRNRVQLRGQGDRIGYFARGTNALVPVASCLIAHSEINQAIPTVQKKAKADFGPNPYKVEIQHTPENQTRYFFNRRHGSGGFRQVNDEQNENLRNEIEKRVLAELRSPQHRNAGGNALYDLFGGEGNLSEKLWPHFKQTHVVDQGVQGQRANVRFHSADVSTWFQKVAADQLTQPTILIIDPPREGWPEIPQLRAAFENPYLTQILLVGCDPDAWARDVSRLTGQGGMNWVLTSLAIFDFFPQTHHVESLAQLRRPSSLG